MKMCNGHVKGGVKEKQVDAAQLSFEEDFLLSMAYDGMIMHDIEIYIYIYTYTYTQLDTYRHL